MFGSAPVRRGGQKPIGLDWLGTLSFRALQLLLNARSFLALRKVARLCSIAKTIRKPSRARRAERGDLEAMRAATLAKREPCTTPFSHRSGDLAAPHLDAACQAAAPHCSNARAQRLPDSHNCVHENGKQDRPVHGKSRLSSNQPTPRWCSSCRRLVAQRSAISSTSASLTISGGEKPSTSPMQRAMRPFS